MRIGIDIMGGDYAPQAALDGIGLAAQNGLANQELVLIGQEEVGRKWLESQSSQDGLQLVPASQVIEMGESPTKAITQKTDSSIAKGFQLLAKGEIDVFLSAGNTGAMLVGAIYSVKPVEGVMRPTITSLIPKVTGGYGILLDVGANADCKPDVLQQFAVLGSIYARAIYDIEKPRVALLNIGTEAEKGNLVTQNAYKLLEETEKLNFVGNIEGYDIFSDKTDVIICDGFTGNIVLKEAEAMRQIMKKRGLTDEYFEKFDYENYGGTPILGVNKPVIIGHGVSSPEAFHSMIKLAANLVESNLIPKIKQAFVS